MMRIKKKLRPGWDLNPQPKDKHDLEELCQFYHQMAGQFLGFVFNTTFVGYSIYEDYFHTYN